MAMQNEPFDGTLWFLTRSSSDKVDEIFEDQKVTLTFAEPKDSVYVALKGTASVNQDRAKIKELWNPMYKAWFSGGETDPQIAVLKVNVHEGDFWEASGAASLGLRAMPLRLSQVAQCLWGAPGTSRCRSVKVDTDRPF